jgi:hypothetical protein
MIRIASFLNRNSGIRSSLLCLLLLFGVWMTAGALSAAESDGRPNRTPSEYEVKAAYLYYFAKFVEWPEQFFPSDNSPIIIGIAGDDPFGSILEETIRGKKVQNRSVVIRRLQTSDDLSSCHILFFSSLESGRSGQVFKQLESSHVLTVCESQEKDRAKCMIHFLLDGGKVQFDVDVGKTLTAGLKISSKLMMVARVLRNDPTKKKN